MTKVSSVTESVFSLLDKIKIVHTLPEVHFSLKDRQSKTKKLYINFREIITTKREFPLLQNKCEKKFSKLR